MAEITKITTPLMPRENVSGKYKPETDQAFNLTDTTKVHKPAQDGSKIIDQNKPDGQALRDSMGRAALEAILKDSGSLMDVVKRLALLVETGVSTSQELSSPGTKALLESLFINREALLESITQQDKASVLFKGETFDTLRDLLSRFDGNPKVSAALGNLLKIFEHNVNTGNSIKSILLSCDNILDYMFKNDREQFSSYLDNLARMLLPKGEQPMPNTQNAQNAQQAQQGQNAQQTGQTEQTQQGQNAQQTVQTGQGQNTQQTQQTGQGQSTQQTVQGQNPQTQTAGNQQNPPLQNQPQNPQGTQPPQAQNAQERPVLTENAPNTPNTPNTQTPPAAQDNAQPQNPQTQGAQPQNPQQANQAAGNMPQAGQPTGQTTGETARAEVQGQQANAPAQPLPEQGRTTGNPPSAAAGQPPEMSPKEAAQVLKGNLLPLLGEIVVKYNQNERIRDHVMVVVHNIVRVDQGTPDALREAVNNLAQELRKHANLPESFSKNLLGALSENVKDARQAQNEVFSKLTAVISDALRSENSAPAVVRQAENLMVSLLQNQSPMMNLLHFILPFQTRDDQIFAELYVDPDSQENANKRGGKESRKFFLSFESEKHGAYEMSFVQTGEYVDFAMWCPENLVRGLSGMKRYISDIMQTYGYTMNSFQVDEMKRQKSIVEVFPHLLDKRVGIDVRV